MGCQCGFSPFPPSLPLFLVVAPPLCGDEMGHGADGWGVKIHPHICILLLLQSQCLDMLHANLAYQNLDKTERTVKQGRRSLSSDFDRSTTS